MSSDSPIPVLMSADVVAKSGHSKPSATPASGQVFGNGVNQLDDLGATAVAFDSCFVRVATGPAEAPVRYRANVGAVDGLAVLVLRPCTGTLRPTVPPSVLTGGAGSGIVIAVSEGAGAVEDARIHPGSELYGRFG